jgi:hypothetical protein
MVDWLRCLCRRSRRVVVVDGLGAKRATLTCDDCRTDLVVGIAAVSLVGLCAARRNRDGALVHRRSRGRSVMDFVERIAGVVGM